jgi:hypothetical protein
MASQGKAQASQSRGPALQRNQDLSARAWLPDIPAYWPGNQVLLIAFGCSPYIDIIVYYCHLCQFFSIPQNINAQKSGYLAKWAGIRETPNNAGRANPR